VRKRPIAAPRPGAGPGVRRQPAFPGEASWRWHLQLDVERMIAPLRALLVAATAIAWFTRAGASAAPDLLADVIIALGVAYVVVDWIVVFRYPGLGARLPWGSAVLDFALVCAWIYATGGAHSSYRGLAYVGLVSATFRLPREGAIAMTAAYTIAMGLVVGPAHWYEALYILVTGFATGMWASQAGRDRRNNLRDALTGCFNREYATFRLGDLYRRRAFPLAIAGIDLDGFKNVNDTYGHAAGDAVLAQAVRVIGAQIRQGDLLSRSGGDEFVLVLPATDEDVARAIAERVRRGVELRRFRLRADLPTIRLTASIGVAVAYDETVGAAALLELADRRLYCAKDAGRNRVWSTG